MLRSVLSLAVVVLASLAVQAESSPCVILKRMGPADEVTSRLYSFGIRGKQFQFVEGQLPKGIKFHGRLTDNDVRKIEDKGGKIEIVEPKYTADDLRQAREGCRGDADEASQKPAAAQKEQKAEPAKSQKASAKKR